MTFERREEISKILDGLQRDVTHEYFNEPIPSPTDEVVSRLVQLLGELTLGDREQLLYGWFDVWQLGALSTFSVRMSSLAVREKSRELLFTALLAEVFDGFRIDFRDGGIQALAVAYDAAGRIGEDPATLFGEATVFARPEMATEMTKFLGRSDLPEILTIMLYKEGSEPGGFRYEYMQGTP